MQLHAHVTAARGDGFVARLSCLLSSSAGEVRGTVDPSIAFKDGDKRIFDKLLHPLMKAWLAVTVGPIVCPRGLCEEKLANQCVCV